MPQSRDYLGVLFDQYPTGVMIADDRALYVDVNQAACRLLGRNRDELVGQHLSSIIAPGRAAEVDLQWQAFIRDGSQLGVFDVVLPDGSTSRLQFNARANFSPGLHCSFLSQLSADQHRPVDVPTLSVCAWTKRVLLDGEWLRLEEYLLLAHGKYVSHGISPEAFAKALDDTEP